MSAGIAGRSISRVTHALQRMALAGLFVVSCLLQAETVTTSSPQDVFDLFDRIGYTEEAWKSGVREVPKIFITHIPQSWQENSQKMPVEDKKALFFRLTSPAILYSNRLIKEERRQLIAIAEEMKRSTITKKQRDWLIRLAKRYKVKTEKGVDEPEINELLLRVDVIPVSLALAQAAEESGWGTSRFAVLGNALFGQWDFSGKGIKPEQQRKELGNYGIARFGSPQESVNAYMRNLNTHRSYASLRELRAKMRQNGEPVTGYKLATKLNKYSERGEAYVEDLHTIMRVNNLGPTDEAFLWNKETIFIRPMGK